jgi:Cu2+-exporting ATPase
VQLVAAMERHNRHPLADALRLYVGQLGLPLADEPLAITTLHAVPGRGIEAEIAGAHYRLGGYAFAHGLGEDAHDPADAHNNQGMGRTPRALTWLYLSQLEGARRTTLARFALEDPLREDAAMVIGRLQARGIRVHLLSGDAHAPVQACAQALGLSAERVRARLTPLEKQAYVTRLRTLGACVVAMGDGTNDAPMLSAASVGIGLGSGSALATLSADAVQSTDRVSVLDGLEAALQIATRARHIVKQNLAWALAYNAVAIPAAFVGVVTPLGAAIGMAASSMMVVLNAARLQVRAQER